MAALMSDGRTLGEHGYRLTALYSHSIFAVGRARKLWAGSMKPDVNAYLELPFDPDLGSPAWAGPPEPQSA